MAGRNPAGGMGRVCRLAASVLVALAALSFAAPALAQSLSVGIESDGTGDATAVEGDLLTFTVKMSATKTSDVTVKWRFVAGTAGAPDYSQDGSRNLTISQGSTSTPFVIDIVDDTRHENAETFEVEIYDASGATISRSKATVTINVDANQPDTPQFRVDPTSVTVDEDAGSATVTVLHVSFPSDAGDITIPYSAVGITATATADFDASGGTATFAMGTLQTQTVQIPIVDEGVVEGDETFEVRFGAPSAGEFTGGANKATVTIRAHDEIAQAPTAASGSVTTGADADYGFTAADFNFSDANGDPLSSVTIMTLPGRGALKLGAANVYRGQSVPRARIDAGDLTYTPPRGQVGKRISYFTFKVNDGEFDSTATYRMTIDVDRKLAGNLGQTAASDARSLPDTGARAYAQRFRTGSSAQELEEVKLAITVPSGTTPRVSIWYGEDRPERERLVLNNPSNINSATDAVKSFKAAKSYSLAPDSEDYWIVVVRRAMDTGTISLKQTTAGNDAMEAKGWALTGNHWKRNVSNSWSQGTSGALQAELRTVAWRQLQTRVVGVELSDPGPDNLYTHDEELRITVTFNETVSITGATILDPTGCGGRAVDRSGHGTNRIVFGCRIRGGPYTRVHVRENGLRPGTAGDGKRVSEAHPAVEKTTAVHGLTGPGITDVIVSSPGSDGLWTAGETVEVRYVFSGPVTVATGSGTPVTWVRRVSESGRTIGEVVPYDRVEGNTVVFAKTLYGRAAATALEIPRNSVYPKNRVIAGTDTGALAVLTHRAYRIEPGRPCGSLADELWCAEMTVGRSDPVTGFRVGVRSYGSLSSRLFTYGVTEYTINYIYHDASNRELFFEIDHDAWSTIFNKAGFALHVGGRSYAFPTRVRVNTIADWNNIDDPGWSSPGDRVIVRLTGPAASGNQVEVEPPTVADTPVVSPAGTDGQWTEGEAVEVTLAFSEAVEVVTASGVPSVGLGLGGPAATRSAPYLRGSGTAELVFGYTLVDGDGAHTVMAVTPDSLALNGGAIRSVETSADAALGHNGTAVQGRRPRSPEGPSARFEGVPENHDGTGAFTVELHFSAEPAGLSYRTVQGGMLEVEGGTVRRAARTTRGSNQGWRVTVAPSGVGDVQIRLPARPCGKANAACIGGRPLEQAAQATIPGTAQVEPPPPVPLTASFSGAPAEHDGTGSFELRFHLSAEPAGLSYRTVQNGLFDVTGATIARAWRLQRGNDAGWGLRIEPSGFGDVTLALRATTDCAGTPGVCTADGRMLGSGLQATIAGPPTLAVADAEVEEGSGAVLDFAVSLSRALTETVTVGYRTADGTASAGADYTNTTGTLTFAAGETSKTVSVAVLDDEHDEGSETMTLSLRNPSPARVKLSDAEATGTINNTDAMPKAWLARFGRTVAGHVLDGVAERMKAPRAAGLSATLGGQALPGMGLSGDAGARPSGAQTREAEVRAKALSDWLNGESRDDDEEARRIGSRTVTGREMALGSVFSFTGETAEGGTAGFWGRAAVSGFDGREGELSLDGEVTTGLLGADYGRGRWLMGLIASHSRGEGSYRGSSEGTVSSTLTGVHPWARYAVGERLSVWGAAGYGAGTLTLTPKNEAGGDQTPMQADLSLAMGAAGARGELLEPPGDAGGPALALVSDAMFVRTESESTRGLAAASADVTRLRLALDGSWRFVLEGGSALTPSLELGVRHDGGDAETGYGVDVGGGLAFADPKRGLTFDVSARTLVAHEESEFGESGITAALSFDPRPSTDRGFTMSLRQTLGASSTGGADALMGRETLTGFGANDNSGARRLELTAGYGIAMFGGRFTGTPDVGVGFSDTGRDYRLGWRLGLGSSRETSFELGLEATRRDRANDNKAEHTAGFRIRAAW